MIMAVNRIAYTLHIPLLNVARCWIADRQVSDIRWWWFKKNRRRNGSETRSAFFSDSRYRQSVSNACNMSVYVQVCTSNRRLVTANTFLRNNGNIIVQCGGQIATYRRRKILCCDNDVLVCDVSTDRFFLSLSCSVLLSKCNAALPLKNCCFDSQSYGWMNGYSMELFSHREWDRERELSDVPYAGTAIFVLSIETKKLTRRKYKVVGNF